MDRPFSWWMIEPLRRYAQFSGRARRKEFWAFELLMIALTLLLVTVDIFVFGTNDMATNTSVGPLSGLFSLAILIPSIAVSVRRLHDLDKSGWWLLIGLLPIVGVLVLLFWYCSRGTTGPNSFGADPLTSTS